VPRFYQEFGSRLREQREAAGLSQQQLAVAIGLTRSSIANIEAGRQRVALHHFARFADALRVTPTSLLPMSAPILDDALLEDASRPQIFREITQRWIGAPVVADK
jgi:transcriptional regulator with XRE-family HTH domain